jgi:hypothetical protein
VRTNTDLQPKKLSSPKKSSKGGGLKTSKLITANAWWPFDRVDGKILESLHKQHVQRGDPAPF